MPTLGDLAKPPDLPQEQLEREACGIVQSQNSSTSRTVRVALSGFGVRISSATFAIGEVERGLSVVLSQ